MKEILKKALPWIGAAATGNIPLLVTMAAKEVGEAIGAEVAPDADEIASAVSGATPDQIASLREKENEFKLKMQALGFQHAEELERIGLEREKAFLSDGQDARAKFSMNENVFRLGVVILVAFSSSVGLSMWGAYLLLSGGIEVKDVGIVAAIFGFLGTIIGYLAASAQQVVGFFFGSSKGSSDNREALTVSMQQLGAALARK